MADLRLPVGRSGFAALLALLCMASGQAFAQEDDPFTKAWITNIRSDPARCNLGRARRVGLAATARDYRSMLGRCVAVRGHWARGALFLHARDASAGNALYADRFAGSRIGLYGPREIMHSPYARARLEVTAVGVLGSCDGLGDRHLMVVGYCERMTEGPYLALAEMYLEP